MYVRQRVIYRQLLENKIANDSHRIVYEYLTNKLDILNKQQLTCFYLFPFLYPHAVASMLIISISHAYRICPLSVHT